MLQQLNHWKLRFWSHGLKCMVWLWTHGLPQKLLPPSLPLIIPVLHYQLLEWTRIATVLHQLYKSFLYAALKMLFVSRSHNYVQDFLHCWYTSSWRHQDGSLMLRCWMCQQFFLNDVATDISNGTAQVSAFHVQLWGNNITNCTSAFLSYVSFHDFYLVLSTVHIFTLKSWHKSRHRIFFCSILFSSFWDRLMHFLKLGKLLFEWCDSLLVIIEHNKSNLL